VKLYARVAGTVHICLPLEVLKYDVFVTQEFVPEYVLVHWAVLGPLVPVAPAFVKVIDENEYKTGEVTVEVRLL
jgi:hypothetical protein